MGDRTIFHIDMNSCFASIECLHNPEIRSFPVAVGGSEEARHGIILAKNELAKKAGVKTGEPLWQARSKCPDLIVVPPHYDQYMRFSRIARQIYSEYSDRVEPFGIDEAWVDVTGCVSPSGASALAEELRQRIKFELGITVSIGVSYNKIFSKLGSDYKKPDAVTVLGRDRIESMIWPLPASSLLCVGPATTRKLRQYGIRTIGDIAQVPEKLIESWLGKMGLVLSSFARGTESSPVARAGDEAIIKSIGNSTTAPRDLTCEEDASIVFYMLCESVAERMRDEGFLAGVVQISLRDTELFSFERQTKLHSPTCLASELHSAALELLRTNYDWHRPLRSIGIRACGLVPESSPQQTSIFHDEGRRHKREELERTVDDIRRRFGHYSISRAITTLDSSLDHIDPKHDHTIHPVGYFKAQ